MTTNIALEPRTLHAADPETSTRSMLRRRIGGELEMLSAQLASADVGSPAASGSRSGRVALANIQRRMRMLGQLLAGLADPRELNLDRDCAGFGSSVEVRDGISGERFTIVLMTGATIDVLDNHVSMDSPIGAALIGARPGDVVEVETPAGERRLEVLRLATLPERFS